MYIPWWKKFDWWLAGAVVVLTLFGLAMIASSTLGTDESFARNQLLFCLIGVVAVVGVAVLDYRILLAKWWLGYGVILGLLLLVSVLGKIHHGAESWLQLGPFSLQPSELMKLVLVISFAALAEWARLRRWSTWLLVGGFTCLLAVPVVLTLLQPDFGTASVMMVVWLVFIWLSPLSKRLLAGLAIGLLVVALIGWHLLAPYQQQRITTFMNPGSSPLGAGYNVLQSQIAVGSGQWLGLGWGRGTQSHLNFLPEHHTDFIFASLSEEFGFAGAMVVVALYGVIIWRGVLLAWRATDQAASLLAIGIVTMLMYQAAVNMAMNVGLAPVTGVPLPFVSYGGSSLLTSLCAVGVLESMALRQWRA